MTEAERVISESLKGQFWVVNDNGGVSNVFARPAIQKALQKIPEPAEGRIEDIQEVRLTCAQIINAVARVTGVRVMEITSPRRAAKIMRSRHIAVWLCRKLTDCSYPQIGRALGGRDHSTIMHGVRKIDANYPEYARLVSRSVAVLQEIHGVQNE
jgi:chromosomal replication initiation ATPase DnaA